MRESQVLVQRGTAGGVLIFRQQAEGMFEALNHIFGWSPITDVPTLLAGKPVDQEHFQKVLLSPSILGPTYRDELVAATRGSRVHIVFFRAGGLLQLEDVLASPDYRIAASPSQG
ncbi:MAG: hypothetical protein RLY47_508 [Candidatus Parcubacteria bacterium]|jgi:hypothetical protein